MMMVELAQRPPAEEVVSAERASRSISSEGKGAAVIYKLKRLRARAQVVAHVVAFESMLTAMWLLFLDKNLKSLTVL